MKNILFIVIVLPVFCFAQKDSVITYTDVVKVETGNKDTLYSRAKQWLFEKRTGKRYNLQIDDNENGELAGVMNTPINVKYSTFGKEKDYMYDCFLTFNIKLKDGRYKYTFSSFSVDIGVSILDPLTTSEDCPNKVMMVSHKKMNEIWANAKDGVAGTMKYIIKSLIDRMNKKSDADF